MRCPRSSRMPRAHCHGVSIPPPLIRRELVRALRARAGEVLPPRIAAVVNKTEQPLLQAITDMESPRLTFGRVALLGDAGFVVRPYGAELEGRPTERDPRRIIRDYGAPNMLHDVDPRTFPSA